MRLNKSLSNLTSGFLTMEVWVQALVAHLVDLLHIVGHHVLQELLHVGFGVDALQLLLVEI